MDDGAPDTDRPTTAELLAAARRPATGGGPRTSVASDPAPASDIPGIEGLPADVRERLKRARRDPTAAEELKVKGRARVIQVGSPEGDDIFRTHPDRDAGWWDVHVVAIRKGFGKAAGRRTYLVGSKALENPAVAQRARAGVAILTVTSEGDAGVWVIQVPDMVAAEGSYPYDQVKWECAEAARGDWVSLAWNKEQGIHQWQVVDLSGQPNAVPVWPDEHPLVLIDRAIASVFVDDPDFVEFKKLIVRGARP
jgi:hypothetical protein